MSRALAIIGNGLGNVIEQSAVPLVAAGLHTVVDIWTPRSASAFTAVLTGIPRVGRVYLHNETPTGHYDTVYTSWLMGNHDKEVKASRVYRVTQPAASNKLSEADYFISQLFPGAKTPAVYCAASIPDAPPPRAAVNIAICCGSQGGEWKLKRYPHFNDVVAALAEQLPDVLFYLLGIPSDGDVLHPRVVDLRGSYSLLETIGVLKTCDLTISNDSGLAHASAAHGIPTLVIFGPTQIAKNLPAGATAVYSNLPCQPCQYRSPRIGIHPVLRKKCGVECLNQLHPADIAAQAMLLLRNKLAVSAV
jgi:ADP-heptose:LPS heptosyltransferase